MTGDERKHEVVDGLGRPIIDPPEGGPNADPESPHPGDLVPPRPGCSLESNRADPESG